MNRPILVLAAGVALAAAWWVLRDPPARHPDLVRPLLARMDPDRDGGISASEYAAIGDPGLPFAALDANGDGRIDDRELEDLLRFVPAETLLCVGDLDGLKEPQRAVP